MSNIYVPNTGDIVWMDFDPVIGSEQGGRRPALVLTYAFYNDRSGLFIVCPITSQVKGYPFEVLLPTNLPISGVVLVDHIKNQDWKKRNVEKIVSLKPGQLKVVLDMLKKLLF